MHYSRTVIQLEYHSKGIFFLLVALWWLEHEDEFVIFTSWLGASVSNLIC